MHDVQPDGGVAVGGSLLGSRRDRAPLRAQRPHAPARQALPDLPRPFTCAGGTERRQGVLAVQVPTMCPGSTCVDGGGRDPQQALLYTNLVYNDPVVLRFDPPILISRRRAASGSHLHLLRPLRQRQRAEHPEGEAPLDLAARRRDRSTSFTIGGPCARQRDPLHRRSATRTSCATATTRSAIPARRRRRRLRRLPAHRRLPHPGRDVHPVRQLLGDQESVSTRCRGGQGAT